MRQEHEALKKHIWKAGSGTELSFYNIKCSTSIFFFPSFLSFWDHRYLDPFFLLSLLGVDNYTSFIAA